jgi:hypothetical protein
MRILALYPAFDVRINEMAMVWQRFCARPDNACLVIAGAQDVLKGFRSADTSESSGTLTVHRTPALRATEEFLALARDFRPDLIYCAVTENLRFARALRRHTGAPMVLHTEFFLDDLTFLRRRYHGGIPPIRRVAGAVGREVLHRMCDGIIVSNPAEQRMQGWATFPRLRYLPWPHPGPGTTVGARTFERDFSAHIGSFSHGKGARYLGEFYGALLDAIPGFRLQLVGPAIDEEGTAMLGGLKQRFGSRVEVRGGCPRNEAMILLGRSLFVFSPAARYGWGLIGDAWGLGTAVISRTEHYDLRNGENCLVAPDVDAFVRSVRTLAEDAGARERITAGGTATVAAHAPDAVAATLEQILRDVLR